MTDKMCFGGPRASSADVPSCHVDAERLTDVFFDFDGTLTMSKQAGLSGFTSTCRHLFISDALASAHGPGCQLAWRASKLTEELQRFLKASGFT